MPSSAAAAAVRDLDAGPRREASDAIASADQRRSRRRPRGRRRRRPARADQRLAEQPGSERAGRRRDVADEVVPGEGRGPPPVRHDWVSAACSTARNGPTSFPVGEITPTIAGQDQQRQPVGRARTRCPATTTSRLLDDEDPTPAEPVRVRRQPQRDERVADEGQRRGRPRSPAGRGRSRRGTGRGRPRGTRTRTSARSAARTAPTVAVRGRAGWRSATVDRRRSRSSCVGV